MLIFPIHLILFEIDGSQGVPIAAAIGVDVIASEGDDYSAVGNCESVILTMILIDVQSIPSYCVGVENMRIAQRGMLGARSSVEDECAAFGLERRANGIVSYGG